MNYGDTPHFHRQIILDELKKIQFDTLLEVGCGEGTNMFFIKRDFPNVQVFGLDNDANKVYLCEEQFGRDFCQKGTADYLPYKDKSFDVVLLDAILMYLGEEIVEKAIQEAYRVAKKAVIVCDRVYFDKIENPDMKIPIQGWDDDWDKGFILVKYLDRKEEKIKEVIKKKRGRPKKKK